MWADHPFSQRNKATKKWRGLDYREDGEGGLGKI